MKTSRITAFVLGVMTVSTMGYAQNWMQLGQDVDGEVMSDENGGAVSISSDGNTIAVGANKNSGNGIEAGHVRVHDWDGANWNQRGLDIDGEASGDLSGYSVSLSSDGNTLAIGARKNDGSGNNSGHVRIYEWSGTAWNQKGLDIGGENTGDLSGESVSLSSDGNTVAIGAPGSGFGSAYGHVRVFEWNGTTWNQKGLDLDGEAPGDVSGEKVSLSSDGNVLAIGARGNDENGNISGHVRVYEWNGTSWNQRGLDIDGEATNDESGSSVSLSSDGNTLAIGARGNDGAGGSGSFSGHVRVYEWNGTTWNQKGLDLDGESGDFSGLSVSISANGNIVAIGALDGSGGQKGNVRVYEWTGTTWNQKGVDVDGDVNSDRLGASVAMSANGNRFVTGATQNFVGAGYARVYEFENCVNTTGIDTQTACNSFTWIDGNTYTLSNNSAMYTITNAAGCDSIVTLDLTINTVNALTSIMDFTITADAQNATYQWIDCDNNNASLAGETSQTFTATSNGDYAVVVTENGCSDTSTCVAITTIGLEETIFNSSYSLYPNPSNGEVQIAFNETQEELSISVLDMHGRIISEHYLTNVLKSEIQLGTANGMYLVRIASKDQFITERIYKQ